MDSSPDQHIAAMQALCDLQLQINSELEASTSALEAHKVWAMEAIASQYDSEMRKHRQLAALYICELERIKAELEQGKGVEWDWQCLRAAPAFLHFRSYRNDAGLRKVIVHQIFRNPLAPEDYFSLLLQGKASNQVTKEVAKIKKAIQKRSLGKVKKAIWICEILSKCPTSHLSEEISKSLIIPTLYCRAQKIEEACIKRSSIAANKDCYASHSLSSRSLALLKLDQSDKISICQQTLQRTQALSTSLLTARLLWTLGTLIVSFQPEKAKQLLQSALQILTTHYPIETWTADYSFKWARLEGGRELYEQASDRIGKVCRLQGLKRRTKSLLLTELADCLKQVEKEGKCEEVGAFAASIADDFNPKQAKRLPKLLRSLYF